MITFSLLPTPLGGGQVSLVLRLYRSGALASTTTIATVDRPFASMVLLKCRVHLRNLGVPETASLRPAS